MCTTTASKQRQTCCTQLRVSPATPEASFTHDMGHVQTTLLKRLRNRCVALCCFVRGLVVCVVVWSPMRRPAITHADAPAKVDAISQGVCVALGRFCVDPLRFDVVVRVVA